MGFVCFPLVVPRLVPSWLSNPTKRKEERKEKEKIRNVIGRGEKVGGGGGGERGKEVAGTL